MYIYVYVILVIDSTRITGCLIDTILLSVTYDFLQYFNNKCLMSYYVLVIHWYFMSSPVTTIKRKAKAATNKTVMYYVMILNRSDTLDVYIWYKYMYEYAVHSM